MLSPRFARSIQLFHHLAQNCLRFLLLSLLWHPKLDAVLFQLGDKDLPDRRIFILVFNQVAAFACAGLPQTMRASAAAQRTHEPFPITTPGRRNVARRIMARVEVLMKPTVRRHEQTSFNPIYP